ncbi:VOC family protein [Chitinophagaceae bacterium LWZ2-11]
MRFKKLTPMLWTSDLKATAEFYKCKLNFELDALREDWGWCSMHKDDVEIMFALPNEHTPYEGPHATATFYIYTDEVDELWEQLKNDSEVFYSIANFSYNMREFAIKDNNGYILQFGRQLREGEKPEEETE